MDLFQAGQVVLNYPSLCAIWEIHCKTTLWVTATQSLGVHFQLSHLLIGIGRSSHFKSKLIHLTLLEHHWDCFVENTYVAL